MNDFKTTFDKNKLWQYYHHLIWADKLSQSTVKRKLAGLKKFCQWAAGKGLIEKNPFEESKEGEMKPPPARRLGVSVLGSASFLPASSASTEAGGIRRREIKN